MKSTPDTEADRFEKQEVTILRHLKRIGTITPRRSVDLYDIWRLSSVINRLRNKGHNIKTELIHMKYFHYGQYKLIRNKKAD